MRHTQADLDRQALGPRFARRLEADRRRRRRRILLEAIGRALLVVTVALLVVAAIAVGMFW